MLVTSSIRAAAVAALCVSVAATAQAQSKPKPAHPPVCPAGVRVYTAKADIPVPNDTVALPDGPPVRVTSPEEAEAAELEVRRRAGSAGANALLETTETLDQSDGQIRMARKLAGYYIPADSARAAAACKGR